MSENKSSDVSIKDIIYKYKETKKYLFSKWKFLLLISSIGAVSGYIYAKSKKDIYISELNFALEGGESESLGSGIASQLGIDLGGSSNNEGMFSGSNIMELFKTRRMVEKTLLTAVPYEKKIISLAEMFIINNKLRLKWNKNKRLKNTQFLPTRDRSNYTFIQDSILGVISEGLINTDINIHQKDKKSSIITIEVKSKNEIFAKYFTESIAQVVADDYIEIKSKKARLNLSILQRETDSIRQALNNAISGVAKANDNTFSLNPALNVHRIPSAKKEVDVKANSVILEELVKQLEMSKVTLRRETPFIQIIDKPILPLKFIKFGKLKGIILGSFLSLFLSILFLLSKKLLKKMTK